MTPADHIRQAIANQKAQQTAARQQSEQLHAQAVADATPSGPAIPTQEG